MDIGPGELVLVVLLVVLLFGAQRLPRIARSLGEAAHELRRGRDEREPPASS